MKTFIEQLNEDIDKFKKDLQFFINKHSNLDKLSYIPKREQEVRFVNLYSPYNTNPDALFAWESLSAEGKFLQTELLKTYKSIINRLKLLALDLPSQYLSAIEAREDRVIQLIEQNKVSSQSSKKNYLRYSLEAFEDQTCLLEYFPEPKNTEYLILADTNALLTNSDIENWSFADISRFTLVLVPTVLNELDNLKRNANKIEILRKKAETFVNKIKEYHRRSINQNVSIYDGIILSKPNKIKFIGRNPDLNSTLRWLREENEDDNIIASYFEAARENPHSYILVITTDANMGNKLNLFNIPFTEPPKLLEK